MIKLSRPECPNTAALRSNYKFPANKSALIDAGYWKCMYCESRVNHIDYWDVEHIKPKSLFPELEFEWSNLWYACTKCNNAKLDKHNAATPFIDPYSENPEEHLTFSGSFLVEKRWSERGELTIHPILWINLNRAELIEKRNEKIKTIQKAINICFRTADSWLRSLALEELKKEYADDKEYSLCVRTLLKAHELP